jgi:hypothetical protein
VEFLLAIGAAVALFWVTVAFARGGIIGGALAVLAVGTYFGHAFYNVSAGPVPITADRILLAVLVGQYLLFRQWGWIKPGPLAKSDYILGALLVVLTLSTLAHDFHYRGNRPLSQLVLLYMAPAAMYWVVRHAEFDARGTRWLLGSLVALGVYLAVTAVAETHQVWTLVFPRYIGSPDVREFLGRARGPLLNPIGNGILLGLTLCASLVSWPWLGRVGRAAILASLPLLLWGLYATMTRSVWMGAALGLAILAAAALPARWRVAVLGAGALAAALVLVAGWEHLLAFKRDRDLSADTVAESVELRPILATVAWHMFLDRPIFGCGYGQYVQAAPPYFSDRSTDLPLEKARPYVQHNVFLALLTETGLVGMGLFVALLGAWTLDAWRLWRNPLAPAWARQYGLLFVAFMGVYVANGMFHDVSLIAMMNMYLFFLGGAVVAVAASAARSAPRETLRVWRAEEELVGAT